MTGTIARTQRFHLRLIVITAGLAALNQRPGAAQSQDVAAPPKFEVVSVKLSDPSAPIGGLEFRPGGGFVATNVALRTIIQRAYDVRDFQLLGGPSWLRERYAIEAKPPAGSANETQTHLMLQALLAERFQLKIHRESKDLPVYALTAGKNGLKIQPSKSDSSPVQGAVGVGRGSVTAKGATFGTVAIALSRLLDLPVVDDTQLPGNYDFRLHYDPSSVALQLPGRDRVAEPGSAAQPPDPEPSIFTALQEQLGLKLEQQRKPIEVLVIDSIERPSGN